MLARNQKAQNPEDFSMVENLVYFYKDFYKAIQKTSQAHVK